MPEQTSLEKWLQLPDSTDSAPVEPFPAAETGVSEPVESACPPSDTLQLPFREQPIHVDYEVLPFEPVAEPVVVTSIISAPEPIPSAGETKPDKREIRRLETLLSKEFGDTLTGFNAMTAPIGATLIALALLMWLGWPVAQFLNHSNTGMGPGLVFLGVSAFLGLAGLHFILYWAVHKGSNTVKSKDLDRIIDLRRVDKPCAYLDCDEVQRQRKDFSGKDHQGGSDLRWRCSWFDTELERKPLCAVCNRYEPGDLQPGQTKPIEASPVEGDYSL